MQESRTIQKLRKFFENNPPPFTYDYDEGSFYDKNEKGIEIEDIVTLFNSIAFCPNLEVLPSDEETV